MQVSKSQFKQIVMPPVGTVVEGKYKVDYVHYGKLKFTAKGTPMMGDTLIWEGRKYVVNYFVKEDKFYAEFAGFVENPTVGDNVNVEDIEVGQESADFSDDTTSDGPPDFQSNEIGPTEEHDCPPVGEL